MSEPAGISDHISDLLYSFICIIRDDLALQGHTLPEADKWDFYQFKQENRATILQSRPLFSIQMQILKKKNLIYQLQSW